MLAIVCVSVCCSLGVQRIRVHLCLLWAAGLWWAFFCFSGSPSSCYFIFYICSINLYCTLANKYDDDE